MREAETTGQAEARRDQEAHSHTDPEVEPRSRDQVPVDLVRMSHRVGSSVGQEEELAPEEMRVQVAQAPLAQAPPEQALRAQWECSRSPRSRLLF